MEVIEKIWYDFLAIDMAGWFLLALAGIPALWLLTVYRHRIARVGAAVRAQTDAPYNPEPRPAPPAASVVVVAGDDATALDSLLNKLFEQEYAGGMEVIVVNDGKNDNVKDVVTRIKHQRHAPELYLTFSPAGMRNVSHRKLAATLGVKAAKHPVVVMLTEQSRLYSNQWLARMMAPFAREEVEVVIGSALPAWKSDKGRGKRYRSFTHGADATEWLGAALAGRPWRGHRSNLALRRQLFFDAGGFNGALNLRGGDDDLFVSKVANGRNCATVVSAQAQVRYAHPTPRSEFRQGRAERYYTSRPLGRGERRLGGVSSAMAWSFAILTVLAGALGAYVANPWILGADLALILLTWGVVAATWRATLKALRCRPALLNIPVMVLRRPLTNLRHRLRSRRHRNDYHTWS